MERNGSMKLDLKKVKEISDLDIWYNKMQKIYGEKTLHAITNGGCTSSPKICFVFMNPTGRNIASVPGWNGIHSPWIGTKNVWKMFYRLGLMSEETYTIIQKIKGSEWTEEFAEQVYQEMASSRVFITNLGKCTQVDARPLPNAVYQEYLALLYKEIELLHPEKIITFGNQVSSIVLKQPICVTKCRGKSYLLKIAGHSYPVYPTYYPVGNGMRNMDFAVEDMKKILI